MNEEKVVKLKEQLKIATSNQERFSILIFLSSPDLNYNYNEVAAYLTKAKEIVSDLPEDLIQIHFNQARLYLYQNKLELTKLELVEIDGYLKGLPRSPIMSVECFSIELFMLNIQGKYLECVKVGEEALRKFPEDIAEKEKVWIALGEAEARQGNLNKATDNYEEALTIIKRYKLSKEAVVYYNVAVMFAENGDLSKAEKYFKLALDAYLEQGDFENQILCYGSLANVYSATGQPDKAEEYYQLALKSIRDNNSKRYYFHTLTNYAYFVLNVKNFDKYFRLEKEILEILDKDHERRKHASFFYQTNSRAYLETRNFDKAMLWMEKAEEIEKESNELKAVANILKLKIEIAKSSNKMEDVVAYYEEYILLKEKLLDESKHKSFEEFEAKYEIKLKEKEKEIFRLQKIEMEQKAIRAQLNPHFFFNALNSVNKFILDNDQKNASKFLQKFSGLMRKTLENSEEMFITIEDEIAFLKDYLSLEQLRFNNSFSFEFKVDEEMEEDFVKIPTMLLQPYVENAIKHGVNGKENGKISIDFSYDSFDVLHCAIEDNGHGRKLNSGGNHTSMGTKLLKERMAALSEQFQIEFSIETTDLVDKENKPKGTRVYVKIPSILS